MRRTLLVCVMACALLLGAAAGAQADVLGVEPPFLTLGDPLLAGNETTTFTHAESTTPKLLNAIQVTAAKTGTVETLEYRTNGTANTGVTSLLEGLYADNGSNLPEAEPLCEGTFTGTPAINTWIKVTGLSCKVTSGQKYWLAWSPQGAEIHFNYNSETGAGENLALAEGIEHTNLKAVTWSAEKVFKSGPVGFAAQGTEEFPSVYSAARKLVMMP